MYQKAGKILLSLTQTLYLAKTALDCLIKKLLYAIQETL